MCPADSTHEGGGEQTAEPETGKHPHFISSPAHHNIAAHLLKELFSTSVFINSSDLRPVLPGTLNRLQLNQLGLSSAVWHSGFVPILQLWVKPRGLYIKPVNSVTVREAN